MIDHTGQIFDRWTVLSYHHCDKGVSYWNCRCACGNVKIVEGSTLRNRQSKSCGCLQKEFAVIHGIANMVNIAGQKFNRWTVLSYVRKSRWTSYWNCRCACGTEKVIAWSDLRDEHTRSCGCLMKELAKINRLHQIFPFQDTSIEIKLQNALTKSGITFEKHKAIFGQPDIWISPNVCVFADGDYWHANPEKYKAEDRIIGATTAQEIWDKDQNVTKTLTKQGYKVLRFWEHEINTKLENCVSKLKENYVRQN